LGPGNFGAADGEHRYVVGFGLTWQVPFVLWVEVHEGYVLFEPHFVGLMAVMAVLATLSAAASTPRSRIRDQR
jgi:hypothetical protein